MKFKSIGRFLLSCLISIIMTCFFIMVPSFLFGSVSNQDKAIETSSKVADENSIKNQVIKNMQNQIKDNISIFSLNDCFKKTYYISQNGIKMYKKIGDESSLIKCLDRDSEIVAYEEKDGYIYCEDNFSVKGWVKKDNNNLKAMPLEFSNYIIDVDLTKQIVNIYSNGNVIRKKIACSTGILGNADTETPVGIFKVKKKLVYPNGLKLNNNDGTNETVMYPVQFFSNYLIHSVPIDEIQHNNKVEQEENKVEKSKLGKTASHGCVRVSMDDAKWIYNNTPQNAEVYIHY
ncbi:MAG: L,D-transpeptidase [Clostridium sp.]|uniref:L,D-transpeptidase n=1 Tax=Clostridium sp. TaxID=1506 RepID=UPI0039E81B55